jgi:septal ring factor EnvC (AmiA/AmiB activator)
MKAQTKLSGLIILISMLFLAACTPPPPPVSKDQLSKAKEETLAAEQKAKESAQQKADLEKQIKEKNDKLSTLKQMEKEME